MPDFLLIILILKAELILASLNLVPCTTHSKEMHALTGKQGKGGLASFAQSMNYDLCEYNKINRDLFKRHDDGRIIGSLSNFSGGQQKCYSVLDNVIE